MSLFQALVQSLQLQGERLRNRKFLEASMATSALVATADGKVSFSERAAVDSVLASVEALQVFDVHEAIDLFSEFVREIEGDQDAGKIRAMAAVSAVADDSEAADLVVGIGCAISRADGRLTENERTQVEDIAASLGIPTPAEVSS